MQLDPETIRKLAKITLATRPDELSCEDWVHMVGEYVEASRRGAPLDDRHRLVANHTEECASCKQELDALRSLLDDATDA
jgi:hypothetical protein